MPYGENYGNAERSLAQAIADELLVRDTSVLKLQQIINRLDELIGLLVSTLAADGGFRVHSENGTRFIIQQEELSSTWILRSPIEYPEVLTYVTQIRENILPEPTKAEASEDFMDAYTVRITFGEPCKGFAILN